MRLYKCAIIQSRTFQRGRFDKRTFGRQKNAFDYWAQCIKTQKSTYILINVLY